MRAPFPKLDTGLDTRTVEQCRHNADLLVDVLARTPAARRAVGVQSLDLIADDRRLLARARAARDTQSDFIRPLIAVERAAVQRGAANEIDTQLGIASRQALTN